MIQFRRRCAAVLSLAAVAMVPAVSAAADTTAPTLTADFPAMERGPGYAHLFGTGFTPSATYEVSSDHGEPFTVAGTTGHPSTQATSVEVTTTASGELSVPFTATTDIPAQFTSFVLTVTPSGASSPVASWTERLSPPRLHVSVCPGRTFEAEGDGFPDGTYSTSSPYLRATASSAFEGSLSVRGTAAPHVPTTFTVSLDQAAPATGSFHVTARRKTAALQDYLDAAYGGLSVTGSCFDPGELLVITPLDRTTAAPARAVHASRYGNVSFEIPIRARTAPTRSAGVEVRGASSGDGHVVHAGYTVPGTTLRAGHQLVWKDQYRSEIISPDDEYAFSENDCVPGVLRQPPSGGSSGVWFAPGKQQFQAGCTLTMQSDGNLTLRTKVGRVLWQTHTAGTGHHNRLVMRANGVLTMYTGGGVKVWDDVKGRATRPR